MRRFHCVLMLKTAVRHAISATAVASVDAHQTSITAAVAEVDLDQSYLSRPGYCNQLIGSAIVAY